MWLLRSLKNWGAELVVIGNKPNGYNINKNCGATAPKNIQKAVLEYKAHAGISLDGDGDRIVMVDEKGAVLNGDHILGLSALYLKKTRSIKKVVSTHLANTGLEKLLSKNGMELIRVDVGDRNIMKCMLSENIILGGEPSGHIIFSEHSCTGDACIAALNVLAVMISENKKLSELTAEIEKVPQILNQVPIKKRIPIEELPGYSSMVLHLNEKLKNKGRFHIRLSGTEPLARVMVEGEDKKNIHACAQEISHFLQSHLN